MMESFEAHAKLLRNLFLRIAETGGALVLAILVIYLLLGEAAGPYGVSVANTVAAFTAAVTPTAALALAIILALAYLLRKNEK